MKTEKVLKNYQWHTGLLFFLLFALPILSHAIGKKWTVNVSNYSFSPYNLTHVKAGDTICWVWTEGNHTTTSADIPAGAMAWDSEINNEMTEFTYVPDVNGTYFYRSTLNPDHPMNGTFVVTGASGVDSPIYSAPVVWPNPFSDYVILRYPGNTTSTSVEVFDQTGRPRATLSPVRTKEDQLLTLPAGLTPGIYIFRITSDSGMKTTVRLIKN